MTSKIPNTQKILKYLNSQKTPQSTKKIAEKTHIHWMPALLVLTELETKKFLRSAKRKGKTIWWVEK